MGVNKKSRLVDGELGPTKSNATTMLHADEWNYAADRIRHLEEVIGEDDNPAPGSVEYKKTETVATLSDLPVGRYDGEGVLVRGHSAVNDGGGGLFAWDAASTDSDDNGATILPSGHSGAGRWKRVHKGGYVNALWFGLESAISGSQTAGMATSNTTKLKAAIAYADTIAGGVYPVEVRIPNAGPSETYPLDGFAIENTSRVILSGELGYPSSGVRIWTAQTDFATADAIGIYFKDDHQWSGLKNMAIEGLAGAALDYVVKVDQAEQGMTFEGVRLSGVSVNGFGCPNAQRLRFVDWYLAAANFTGYNFVVGLNNISHCLIAEGHCDMAELGFMRVVDASGNQPTGLVVRDIRIEYATPAAADVFYLDLSGTPINLYMRVYGLMVSRGALPSVDSIVKVNGGAASMEVRAFLDVYMLGDPSYWLYHGAADPRNEAWTNYTDNYMSPRRLNLT